MVKLLKHMKQYIRECILGPLFKLLEALLELFVPLVIAAVIDNGIAADDKNYIIKMCGLLVLMGLVGLAFSITAQYFSAKAAVGFTAKLRHVLFGHIQSLSYSELDTLGTSTLITRMTSDMNQVQAGVNLTLRLLLRSPFVVFGAMIMAFTIDVKSAMTFVYVTIILLIVVFGIMLACIPLYKKVQQKLDSVTSITRENLNGARVIRAFCKEQEETEEFIRRNSDLTSAQKFVGKISALMNPITYVIINLAIILLIHTGAIRVEAGLITQGAVVALYNYMSQILIELIKLANLIINITKSIACGNRIQSVLEIESSITDPAAPQTAKETDTRVEFADVSLRYRNAAEDSLSHISFRAEKGETIGIIGGTGSGKTSLVNMIPRFYDATGGGVLIDGVNVKDLPIEALRERIGVVPQKAVLFKGTIRENLKWGNENATDEELMQAARSAQAQDVVSSKGLDCEIEQGGRNLSGGQRQRLTIARALVKKPEILILDDSASALDFATDAALRKSLRELDYAPTVFIVSQRTSSIRHADKIIVLEDGETAGIGTHDELMNTCPVYREIHESQFKKEDEING